MGSQDDSGWGDPKVNEGNSFGLERLERFSPSSDLIHPNSNESAEGGDGSDGAAAGGWFWVPSQRVAILRHPVSTLLGTANHASGRCI